VVCDKNGQELKEVVLDEVTHLPGAKFNLFSLSKMTRHGGWNLHGDKDALWIEKDGVEIRFDIIIPTTKGALYCMYYKRKNEMAMSVTDQGAKMDIMKAHDVLGHCSEEMTRAAARSMGWVLLGSWKPCKACTVAKAQQKNVPKESEHATAGVGANRIFLYISTIKKTKDGPKVTKPNWRIMVDERTGMKFSDFFETKSQWLSLHVCN
jgi:hypothetical protein